ncbi:MAG: aminotransferase class IV [Alphaproteobacteria bacterium]|nr:aminotransferase class IV [Alphaproteobacteria bacterium]
MSEMCFLNGELVPLESARIDPRDRGFLLGDGLFETLLCHQGEILWLEEHLGRLQDSAAVLKIPLPIGFDQLAAQMRQFYAQSQLPVAALRITLTRGVSESRRLWPASDLSSTLFARLSVTSPSRVAEPAALVTVKSSRRDSESPLHRIKSLNYGAAILARIEAEAAGGDDALLLNQAGAIACTSVGNIFVRLGGEWVTPPESTGILAGLARSRLITLLNAREATIPSLSLGNLAQGLVCNSLQLTPLARLDGRWLEPISLDPLAERLYS